MVTYNVVRTPCGRVTKYFVKTPSSRLRRKYHLYNLNGISLVLVIVDVGVVDVIVDVGDVVIGVLLGLTHVLADARSCNMIK